MLVLFMLSFVVLNLSTTVKPSAVLSQQPDAASTSTSLLQLKLELEASLEDAASKTQTKLDQLQQQLDTIVQKNEWIVAFRILSATKVAATSG